MARMRLSVAAAMKTSPPAVATAPPLFGVPILIGSMEGIPHGPFATRRAERAIPNGSPRAQIDGAYAAIGRLLAEKLGERQAPAGIDVDGERNAHLRVAGAFGT